MYLRLFMDDELLSVGGDLHDRGDAPHTQRLGQARGGELDVSPHPLFQVRHVLHAIDADDEEDVDLDSEDFDAEIAAAIAAADAASERFNNPEPSAEQEPAAEQEPSASGEASGEEPSASQAEPTTDEQPQAASAAAVEEASAPDSSGNADRPQVVDVVTDLEGEQETSGAAAEDADNPAEQQPSAEVVQLPRAPH